VPEEVGIVSTSINLALFLSSLSILGFQGVLTKLIPEYLEKKQHEKIVSLSRFTFKIILLSNLLIILILFFFFPTVQSVLNLPVQALIFSALMLLSFTFSTFFGCIMWGFQNMRTFFTTDLIGVILKVLLTLIFLIAGYGYVSPLAGVLVGYVIIDLRRFRKSWFFPASKEKIKGKEILFDYALPYFTGLIAGLVFSNFQIVLLASLQGQYVTGGYSISFLIASLISIIPNVLSQALFPIISMLSVGKKIKKQAYLLNLVLRYAVFIMLPATIFLIFFSKPILLLLRSEYLEVSNLLSILAVASVFFGLGNLFLSSLYAVGKTKLNRNIWIVSSLIFLIINPILIKLYSAQGLAISYLLSSLFFLILGYYFINKVLTLKVDWKNLSKLLFSSVLFLPFLYVADIMQLDLIIKIAFTILGGIVYLLVLVPLKFYQRDEVKILIFLGKKLPLFKNFLFKLANFLSKHVS
jgi:O-antigen/teichoic acid export membrane protein